MRKILFISAILLLAGCASKDDALYAPWAEAELDDGVTTNAESQQMILNKQLSYESDPTELCVTQITHPHRQTCSKPANL